MGKAGNGGQPGSAVGFVITGDHVTAVSGSRAAETAPMSEAPALLRRLAGKGGRVFGVTPVGATVSRVTQRPEPGLSDEDESAALALLAEAELPAAGPHRVSAGLSPAGLNGERHALLSAWLGDAPPTPGVDPAWIADAAALAHICATQSAGWAVVVDRAAGAASAWIERGVGETPVVRSTRLGAPGMGDDAWEASLARWLTQTFASASIEAPIAADSLAGDGIALAVDGRGVTLGPQGAGTLAAAASALAEGTPALASMRAEPIEPDEPVWRSLALALGRPRLAWSLIAVCLVALAVSPLALAMARHAALSAQAPDETELRERLDEAEATAAFGRLLIDRRWPMTKLLADVAGAAPVGVRLDRVELTHGEGLTVRGEAESRELIAQFRTQLEETRVFGSVATPRTETSGSGVSFQLRAAARAPFVNARPAEDFADKTLAERMYGEGVETVVRAPTSSGSSRTTRASARPVIGSGDAPEVPEPLTDEKLSEMGRQEAMLAWTSRQRLAKDERLDKSVRERLAAEAERAKARMLQAGREGR